MNKLILAIVLVLLLSPFMALAEEQQPQFSEEDEQMADNIHAYYNIGIHMFWDVYKEHGFNYRLSAIFKAFGYKNMAREVLKDVPDLNTSSVTFFYKHKDKYKHHASSSEMYIQSVLVLKGVVFGYRQGYEEALKQFAKKTWLILFRECTKSI